MSIERLNLGCELSFDEGSVIKPHHNNYYLILAVLRRYFDVVDPETKRDLQKCALSAYFKVTVPIAKRCEVYGLDTTPVATVDDQYFRCTDVPTFDFLMHCFAALPEFRGMTVNEFFPVSSRLFLRVVARELTLHNVTTFEAYASLLDELVHKIPEHLVAINFSDLIAASHLSPQACVMKLEELANAKIQNQKIKEKLAPFAFMGVKGHQFFYAPYYLVDDKTKKTYFQMLADWMIRSQGYRLSPDEMWQAIVKQNDFASILVKLGLANAHLAVQFPHLVTTFEQFMVQDSVREFRRLSVDDRAAPYLRVYPEMVHSLLAGLSEHSIDEVFKRRKIEPLLHDAYFLLQRAMQKAIAYKSNMVAFINQIEFMRQIMRTMLAMVRPYETKDLVDSQIERLALPQGLDRPLVHLRRGAMAGIASVLDSIEMQKGSNCLNVLIQKDSYYRIADNMFERIITYDTQIFDTEQGLPSALTKPLDLFVCEFNHNAHKERHIYFQENILLQVKELYQKQLLSPKCTILIDNTIDLDDSQALSEFLHDPLIKRLIVEGKLNVVLLRSAQKLDMFGMDDDFGGITMVLNSHAAFEPFNRRMEVAEDHLGGLEFQSITHNQKHGANQLDKIRRAWMENTKYVLEQISPLCFYTPGTKNPMQVSTMCQNRSFFVHVEFPNYTEAEKAFWDTVDPFSLKHDGLFLRRPSFSYPYTTAYLYRKRFNIGLEDKTNLSWFVKYLNAIQQIINRLGPNVVDGELANAIRLL